MKLYRLIIIFILVTTVCCGQKATIEGLVFNEATNEPISYALVTATDSIVGAQTDFDGKFKIKHLKSGEYNFYVSSFPYFADTLIKGITVPEKGKVKISFGMREIKIKWLERTENTSTCPVCHTTENVIPILYGLSDGDMVMKQRKREAILGGCLLGAQNYYCKKDHVAF